MSAQLEAVERASGAAFAVFTDRRLPVRFAGVRAEWEAVRQGCGLLDARFRGLLRVTGADRTRFLQGMLSNDVAALRAGEGTYAALLTIQGKVVSDLRVYLLADELWLDVPASRKESVREALERFIVADDVEFAADETCVPLVCLEGPHAARTLVGVVGELVDGLKALAHREVTFDGTPVRVVVGSHTGENGYVLFGSADVAAHLWDCCRAAGAEPIGMEALEVLRVEAGIPWHGRDIDESTLIGEAGLAAAINYQKGCYLGQEVVERVAARGQVQRKLVGLICEGQIVPSPHAKLLRGREESGWITSAVWSPARDAVVALGYAKRACWDPGCEMQVALAGTTAAARVVPLPFYARQP